MVANQPETDRDLSVAIYAGAVVTALLTLLPYVSALVFPAYLAGAAVTVWYRLLRQEKPLLLGEAAKLGLYSTFLGGAVAVVVFDVVWQIWDYQIGERQNSQLILGIIGLVANKEFLELAANSLEQSASKSFEAFVIPFQFVSTAVLSGIFGTIFGLVACKAMCRVSRSPHSVGKL
jgi:hypothetical protein